MVRAFLPLVLAFLLSVPVCLAQDNPAAQITPDDSNGDNSNPAAIPQNMPELMRTARRTANPDLTKKVDDILVSAGQPSSPLDFETRYRLLTYCLVPDGQAYYKFIPAILDALNQDPNIDRRREVIVLNCSQFYQYRGTAGVLCGDPQMQQAILALAGPVIHNEDSLVFFDAMGLIARTGDEKLFHRLTISYKSDRRAMDGGIVDAKALPHLQVEKGLLGSVIYRGPLDKRLDTIAENADACTFDAASGRWNLTMPGYEDQPPADVNTLPRSFSGTPSKIARPPDPNAIPKL